MATIEAKYIRACLPQSASLRVDRGSGHTLYCDNLITVDSTNWWRYRYELLRDLDLVGEPQTLAHEQLQ